PSKVWNPTVICEMDHLDRGFQGSSGESGVGQRFGTSWAISLSALPAACATSPAWRPPFALEPPPALAQGGPRLRDRRRRDAHVPRHLERPVPRGQQLGRPPPPRGQGRQPGGEVDAEARLLRRRAAVVPDPMVGPLDGLIDAAGVENPEPAGLLGPTME